jgi:exopolyphosphatase/guanosine-5'-triphosphate,3'-diphosphate pyrophosphatase
MQVGTRLAAVDLGSNSFRLEIGQLAGPHWQRVEYLKETVRQGNGLDANRNLSVAAMQRGWDCLARFGERLAGFTRSEVRAVATQTLREARNRDTFLERGSQLLGFPIDVVSGTEEARLIYQGVAHLLPPSDERRLVVDIGGRSTELILGQGLAARTMASFAVGSVAWSTRYFPDGTLSADSFAHAEVAAQSVLEEAVQAYPRQAWDIAYGSSGTAGAVGAILAGLGGPKGIIERPTLDVLYARLVRAGHVDRIEMDGLKEDRKPVIGGGLSVLRAVFDVLRIDRMQVAQGALRQGVLFDLLDREQPQTDLRAVSVAALARRCDADMAQARRVEKVALKLFSQLCAQAERPVGSRAIERLTRKMAWAAQLHEVGTLISHDEAHKHGAYIVEHADIPGFAFAEQKRMAQLVLAQRGKLRKVDAELADDVFRDMVLCLRLAVLLCHARRDPDCSSISLRPDTVTGWWLDVAPSWISRFPQSAYLLKDEVLAWQKTSWPFRLVSLR